LQEFHGGTDPRDQSSVLRVSLDEQNHTAVVSFPAGANRAFTLQYRDNLNTGPWLDFTNIAPASTHRIFVGSDPLPAGITNRFYRVRVP
jgi:hypothetical protein